MYYSIIIIAHIVLYTPSSQGNKRIGWKRRWAIIRDDVLMFFEMKQDAIKQGWLFKKSSGAGTLGRLEREREQDEGEREERGREG